MQVQTQEVDLIGGSRKVIKDPRSVTQDHFYGFDIWTREALKLEGRLPHGYIVYGELIGWAAKGSPIQVDYEYCLPDGECELYVYRVAVVNPQGRLLDLTWDQMEEFCSDHGLKTVPKLWRGKKADLMPIIDDMLDKRFADQGYASPTVKKGLVDISLRRAQNLSAYSSAFLH